MNAIYLDNAATSFPKPRECFEQGLADYLELGASPGRGGYDAAISAQEAVRSVRERLASFFGAEGFVTCFGANATDALNTLIQGLTKPGSHVVSTRLEHNSVLRPLHHLGREGVCGFDLVPFDSRGVVDPQAVARAIKPQTRLVLLNHGSNVLGTVQPAAEIGRVCREKGVPLVLDVSQTGGNIPIKMRQWGVSGLAFTGHKSLLGPPGIGGLVIDPQLEVRPTRFGGTGVDSANLFHGDDYPERLEAGTINLLGILTLGRCLEYIESPEAARARQEEMKLHRLLLERLAGLKRLELDCPCSEGDRSGEGRLPLVSFNLSGWPAGDVGLVLDGDYGIAVRTGLHCAPLLHQDLGHGLKGSVRVSLGPFNTLEHIETLVSALTAMVGK